MELEERRSFYGADIEVSPDRLWYQDGAGLQSLAEHAYVEAARAILAGKEPKKFPTSNWDRDLEEFKDTRVEGIKAATSRVWLRKCLDFSLLALQMVQTCCVNGKISPKFFDFRRHRCTTCCLSIG